MPGKLERILYLEDDPFIAEIAVIALADYAKFNVRHCVCGSDALEAIPEFKPQLCLFDVMLPDMDGIQTFIDAGKMDDGRDVPVIFMTAKAQMHEQQSYMELGALGVIVKPFDAYSLGERIRTMWAGA